MRRRVRGFTFIEMLTVMVIMAIVATMAMDAIANTEASLRAQRAARETVAALRYARNLAMTTGKTCGVAFDAANQKFWVYQSTDTSYVSESASMAGTANGVAHPYIVTLTTQPELAGTVMSVSLAQTSGSTSDCAFTTLGSTRNVGTVTFKFGGRSAVVTINAVGDPSTP